MGQDDVPAELFELGLIAKSPRILYHFHGIIAAVKTCREVPQEWKDTSIKVPHKEKDGADYGDYMSASLAVCDEDLLKIAANKLGSFRE